MLDIPVQHSSQFSLLSIISAKGNFTAVLMLRKWWEQMHTEVFFLCWSGKRNAINFCVKKLEKTVFWTKCWHCNPWQREYSTAVSEESMGEGRHSTVCMELACLCLPTQGSPAHIDITVRTAVRKKKNPETACRANLHVLRYLMLWHCLIQVSETVTASTGQKSMIALL